MFDTNGFAAGTYTVVAVYSGSMSFKGATAFTSLTINPASTAISFSSLAAITFARNPQSVILSATVTSPAGTVNQGSVFFEVEGFAPIEVDVSNGTANATLNVPVGQGAGTYDIKVEYEDPNGNLQASEAAGSLVINEAATATALVLTPNTGAYSALSSVSVTATATVTSGGVSVNSGRVTFRLGTTDLATVNIDPAAGQAVLTQNVGPGLAVGNYTVTAEYQDTESNYLTSSGTATATVNPAMTAVTSQIINDPYDPRDVTVNLTTTVTNTSYTPNQRVTAGNVVFDVTNQATGVSIGTVEATVNPATGVATAPFVIGAAVNVGTYVINISYADPEGNFLPITNTAGRINITAAPTSLTVSPVTDVYDPQATDVTLTAQVNLTTGTGSSVNAGQVAFTVSGAGFGPAMVTGQVDGTGLARASLVIPALVNVGTYTISAVYSDAVGNFLTSNGSSTLTITPASTITEPTVQGVVFSGSNQNVMLIGQVEGQTGDVNAGTITFTVVGAGAGGGNLTVTSGTVTRGIATANLTLPGGTAGGTYQVITTYNGSAPNFLASSNTTGSLSITAIGSLITLTTSNPRTLAGQTVTFTATVTPPAGLTGMPTGTVTFFDGTTALGMVSLVNGVATFSTSGLSVATHTITAVYSGSTSFGGSTSAPITQTVVASIIAVGAGAGADARIVVYDATTNLQVANFLVYANFSGGVRVAVADFNNDGTPDIVVGAGPGTDSRVVVLDGTKLINTGGLLSPSALLASFVPIQAAGGTPFSGGVFVAAGLSLGKPQLIIGADAGGLSQVIVLDGTKLVTNDGPLTGSPSVLASFYAFSNGFGGGVRVAAGDFNGDGVLDIVVGAGRGGSSQVSVIDGTKFGQTVNGLIQSSAFLTSFFAFPLDFTGGVYVAVGDTTGTGRPNLIVGAGQGGGPQIELIDGTRFTQLQPNGQIANSALISSVFALTPSFPGGVPVGFSRAVGPNGTRAVLTAAGPGGSPQLGEFDALTLRALSAFFALPQSFSGGFWIAG